MLSVKRLLELADESNDYLSEFYYNNISYGDEYMAQISDHLDEYEEFREAIRNHGQEPLPWDDDDWEE